MYVNEYIKNTYRIKDHENRDGYLRLDMNENPEGLPQEFFYEVIKKITPEVIARYPQKDALIDLIAENEKINKNNITLTNGSDEGIRLILETFSHPGSNLLTVSPTFEMYRVYASMFGISLVTVNYNDNFEIDAQEILDKINENIDIVALLNPNSPIGSEYTDEEFRKIIEKSKSMNALVIIDEAYFPFGVDTKMQLIHDYDNVVILRTFSKLCSMAGVRLGYVVADSQIITYIENAQSTYNVNSIGLIFAEELLKRKDIINDLVDTEQIGKQYLTDKLQEAGYEYYSKYGNYVIIKTKNEPIKIASELRTRKILVKTYGSSLLSKYIRITTGSKTVMERFWNAFCEVEDIHL